MMWDGELDFTADDRTLLRAIQIVDGQPEGAAGGWELKSSIKRHLIDKPAFKVIEENTHLRALLKAFLIDNMAVATCRTMLQEENDRWFGSRLLRRPLVEELKDRLKVLESTRDESYKKYEMLRRLTDWENKLLKRVPA